MQIMQSFSKQYYTGTDLRKNKLCTIKLKLDKQTNIARAEYITKYIIHVTYLYFKIGRKKSLNTVKNISNF